MHLAALLLVTTLTIPTQVLVLKTGVRMAVDKGGVTEENGRVLFRSGGALYSLPSGEVDFDATRAAASVIEVRPESDKAHIKVTDTEKQRLLRELEQNHSGKPAPRTAADVPHDPAEKQSPAEKANSEEWQWRREARAHEEDVRQAKEQLHLLLQKAERLRAEINSLVAQRFKPSQFSYQSTELQYTLEQIPQAELSLQRAERARAQFLDDARRLGVMPGWLR